MAPKATKPPYFPHFSSSAGVWQTTKPGFATLAHNSLGGAGTPADSTDSLILNLFNAFNGSAGLMDAISAAGVGLSGAVTATDSIKMGDIDAAIDAATRATGPMITKLGAGLGLLATATQTPPNIGPTPLPPMVNVQSVPGPTSAGGAMGPGGTLYPQMAGSAALTVANTLFKLGDIGQPLMQSLSTIIPVVSIAVSLGLLIAHFIGHGCGAACVDAAKAEQIYELAADNLAAVFKLGMITLEQAVAGMVYFIGLGQQHEATFADKQADKGSEHLTGIIRQEIQGVQAAPKPKPQPLDLTKATAAYVSGPGWYPDSVNAAAQLTTEYLNALPPAKG